MALERKGYIGILTSNLPIVLILPSWSKAPIIFNSYSEAYSALTSGGDI